MDTLKTEEAIYNLTSNLDSKSFLFDLLEIYDFPKATVTRLKNGDSNLSKEKEEYLLKNKFLFKVALNTDPHLVIDALAKNEKLLKHKPRFLIVTNYKIFLAQDLKTYNTLDIEIKDLANNYDFFLPWLGLEKSKLVNEAIADIKAASMMGQLYDIIMEINPSFFNDEKKKLSLNIFFARLLFCYFAEDTELFNENVFTNTIQVRMFQT